MTRTLDEFDAAHANPQQGLTWGVGVHPAVPAALRQWSEERFLLAARRAAVVGEVGLDRRGDRVAQRAIFETILSEAPAALISVHSTGRTDEVVDIIEKHPHPGVILHWFTGSREDAQRAAQAGCYFSINAAMADVQMTTLPLDRILPETDFPSSRSRTQARAPGDIAALEATVVRLTGHSPMDVRRRWYQNLAAISQRAGVQHRLSADLRSLLVAATEE
jgi:TatD DNase family protein